MMKSKKDSFTDYYNKYVHHYNAGSGLGRYNELLSIKTEVNQRAGSIKKQVDNIVTNVKANLKRVVSRAEVCKDEKRATVLESFFERALNTYSQNLNTLATAVPDNNLEILSRAINEFYELHNTENAGESVVLAEDIFRIKESYQHTYLHLMAVRSVTDKILSEDYPAELSKYEYLSSLEKEEIYEGPGNRDFIDSKINMPKGFYNDADELKKDHPKESKSWMVNKLIRKYFNGDKSKKSTIGRRLTSHWNK
jgi:hypothetical protein